MGKILKSTLIEFFFCIVASVSLSYTLSSCFFATQPFQSLLGTGVMAIVSALVLAALFFVCTSRVSTVIGSIAVTVAIICVISLAFLLSDAESILADEESNYVYPALVFMLVAVCVFVLSRGRIRAAVLIVGGVLLCGVIEYLYWYGHALPFAVFFISSVAIYVFQTYQNSLLKSESETLSFGSVSASGIALAAACAALSCAVFVLVIAPLSPPHLTIKLVSEHYRIQVEEVRGTAGDTSTQNQSILSNILGNQTVQSNDPSSVLKNQLVNGQSPQGDATEYEERDTKQNSGSDEKEGESGGGDLGMEFPDQMFYALPLFLFALIVLAVVGKLLLRRRHYNKMLAEESGKAMESLYMFFMKRFEKAKIPGPESLTLAEYAVNRENYFKGFEGSINKVEFFHLSEVYSAHVYGGKPVSDSELALFKDYYRNFYKRMRQYLGTVRYLLRFFSL